ncbi:MAG: hypothetical protein AUH44_00280 [Chloroflexi bacterium 13_1_40CM_68_15]|nr:MAG: hypothetical protein AUH44_00280 [Chloroflexi bacterium 13_1_40CM_68_15]
MGRVEIVEQDAPENTSYPPGPPAWLLALGLCAALLVGFARASTVVDPRLAHRPPAPTPCIQRAIGPSDVNFVWTWCR